MTESNFRKSGLWALAPVSTGHNQWDAPRAAADNPE
jgi:hypothetical protein